MLKRSVLGMSICLFSGAMLATAPQATSAVDFFPSWLLSSYVATLSVGPVWSEAGRTQTFYLTSEIEKTYAAKQHANAFVFGEFFLGLQRELAQQLQGQLGLAVATTSNTKLSGNIWDDADPQFNNYTYRYRVKHTHLAVKGKLLADRGYLVIPWISASLGVGFNRAFGFDNTPTVFEAVQNSNFSAHTQTAFTYTLGAGVQKNISTHWQLGVGYEFSDWGKNHLGRALGQTMNQGLKLNHLYTNGLLFNLTYQS